MSQMFEMMVALKDVIAVRNEEAQSSQQGAVNTQNPNHANTNYELQAAIRRI